MLSWSQREPFLRAIIATPDADLPRLVYADFLDEHGEGERAELIRVQCEMAALSPRLVKEYNSPKGMSETEGWDLYRLGQRERQWLVAHEREWTIFELGTRLGQYHRWPSRPVGTFHRGFIETVQCSWKNFAARYEQWKTRTPLRRVELTTDPPTLEAMTEFPHAGAFQQAAYMGQWSFVAWTAKDVVSGILAGASPIDTAELRILARNFVHASMDRARAKIHFNPPKRLALDAMESALLGAIDEICERLETFNGGDNNVWTQLVIPILMEVFAAILKKKFPPKPLMGSAADEPLMSDAKADELADSLESALTKAPKSGPEAVGLDDGILAHVERLMTSLRNRDWPAVLVLFKDFIDHL